ALARAIHQERERERRHTTRLPDDDGRARQAAERRRETRALELPLQDFARSLRQEQVPGIVALQHIEEQAARHLQPSRRLARSVEAGKYEPRDARELAELPPRHLG